MLPDSPRREFLKTAGAAAFTTALFAGNLRGANDRPNLAFIGCGRMGTSNLHFAAQAGGAEIVAVCDVNRPALERAAALARRLGFASVRSYRDCREILADPSIDAVSLATPGDWHAYMTIEACKAGKDVWCETPACVSVEEGVQMVEAARRYRRVVQAGTVRRSGGHFQKARQIVRSGELGDVAFCNAFEPGSGAQPDRAVHLIDVVQFAFEEAMPVSVSAQGGESAVLATYRYPGFVAAYERRPANRTSGTAFHGTRATLVVNRGGYWIWPGERGREPVEEASRAPSAMNVAHWKNFLECLRTRRRPASDIETCVRSTTTCLLANLALRRGGTLDWDERAYYRSPWKLEV